MSSLKGSLRASFCNTIRATTRYFKAFRVLSLHSESLQAVLEGFLIRRL